MKTVIVGSHNPVKITAVELAFAAVWPDEQWQVHGVSVPSGVADQPMSDDESIRGAINRAMRALAEEAAADYGVGLEGGLQQHGETWYDCGWIAVVDRRGRQGIGATIKMAVPSDMMKLIRAGKELGDVCDSMFGISNAKQKDGFFGLMSGNAVTRTSAYRDGVIAALAALRPRPARRGSQSQ